MFLLPIAIGIIILASSVGTRAYLPPHQYLSTAKTFIGISAYSFQGISSKAGESIVSSRTSLIIPEPYTNINKYLECNCTAAGNDVQILFIQTQPKNISMGDTFHVIANIVNNSPNIIRFISGPCDSALSVTFERNVIVKHGFNCLLAAHLIELKPGEKATTLGPSVGTIYRASGIGSTNAAVTFHYQSGNIERGSLTRPFKFNITS